MERRLLMRLAEGPCRGGELAAEAGLTRSAIWKRVEGLRAAGVGIDARRGHGYSLRQPLSLLDADAIGRQLPAPAAARIQSLDVLWETDSTNSELLRRAGDGAGPAASGCTVVLAERQTGGRGRRGRPWASPLAANLYFSIARQFDTPLARLGGLSLAVGVALAEALRGIGFETVGLKWPNDLYARSSKLGGVLIEFGGEIGGPLRAVVGVGLNVRMPAEAATGIDQAWTDLASLAPGPLPERSTLAAGLVAAVVEALDQFEVHGLTVFLERFAALDILAGQRVCLQSGNHQACGRALGLSSDGGLRLGTDGGGERVFHSGEASLRAAPEPHA